MSVSAKDMVVILGEDVVFECNASGDPMPSLLWRRTGAPLPAGRSRPADNRPGGLKIERVSLADSGDYVCLVENAVGSASASVRLNGKLKTNGQFCFSMEYLFVFISYYFHN